MKSVLLIGSLPRILVPVARTLHEHGIPVYGASFSKTIRSRALNGFVRLPREEDNPELYFAALSKVISDLNIDTVMPCGDEDLLALSRHDEKLRQLVHYCGPLPAACQKILGKTETLAVAAQAGIPVPGEYQLPNLSALTAMRDSIRFPVVVKPRHKDLETVTSIKSEIAHTFEQLRAYFEKYPEFGNWFLIQDFLPGVGIGVEILMDRGNPAAVFQHRRLREYPVRGGVSVAAISESPDPQLVDYSVDLLRALEWQGVAMVEFRKDPVSGRVGLMEVNGRFWGSVALSRFCGIEFPYYLWQIAHGMRPQAPASYPAGVKFRWLGGDLRRLYECFTSSAQANLWRESLRFFLEFPPGAKDSTWSWSDPVPALEENARAIVSVAKTAAQGITRGMIGRLLPSSTKHQLGALRRAGLRNTGAYVQRRLVTRPGIHLDRTKPVGSVVFVCYGNIIRSPFAEAVFRAQDPGIRVTSAGTSAKPGKSADARAIQVAAEFGVSLEAHRAARLSAETVAKADLIVVMDYLNFGAVQREFPEAKQKMILLAGGSGGPVEIEDPYDGTPEDIRAVYRRIRHCTENLVNTVEPHSSPERELLTTKVTT